MSQVRAKDWLEIIGMVAIIASLIFVGLQIRQDRSIAAVDTFDSVVNTDLYLAELIGEHGDVWRRGLDGEDLSAEEQLTFLALAKAVESSFLTSWWRARELDIYNEDSELRDYAMALHSHIGLREAFEAKHVRYATTDAAFGMSTESGTFGGAVRAKLDYLANNSIPVPEEKAYVFWD